MGLVTILLKKAVVTDDGSTDLGERISYRLEENRQDALREIADRFGTESMSMSDWRCTLGAKGPQGIAKGHMFILTAEGQDPLGAILAPRPIHDADPRMTVLTPDSPAYAAILGKRRGDLVIWGCPEGNKECFRIQWVRWLGKKPKRGIPNEV
ncbi:MAG: hypothetical protein Q8Q05_04030 [bacterium]|nr:hypothetical protein [bacterium]